MLFMKQSSLQNLINIKLAPLTSRQKKKKKKKKPSKEMCMM